MNKVWKDSEKQFVRDNCSRMTDQLLGEKLTDITGRKVSIHSVRKLRQSLGLQKKPGRGVCGLVDKQIVIPFTATLPGVSDANR